MYTSYTGFVGLDDFLYTYTLDGQTFCIRQIIHVIDQSTSPVGNNNCYTICQGESFDFNPNTNDIPGKNVAGDTIHFDPTTLSIFSSPGNGTAIATTGSINYTPDTGFFGTDFLTYSIEDGDGRSIAATVKIEVLEFSVRGSQAPMGIEIFDTETFDLGPPLNTFPLPVTYSVVSLKNTGASASFDGTSLTYTAGPNVFSTGNGTPGVTGGYNECVVFEVTDGLCSEQAIFYINLVPRCTTIEVDACFDEVITLTGHLALPDLNPDTLIIESITDGTGTIGTGGAVDFKLTDFVDGELVLNYNGINKVIYEVSLKQNFRGLYTLGDGLNILEVRQTSTPPITSGDVTINSNQPGTKNGLATNQNKNIIYWAYETGGGVNTIRYYDFVNGAGGVLTASSDTDFNIPHGSFAPFDSWDAGGATYDNQRNFLYFIGEENGSNPGENYVIRFEVDPVTGTNLVGQASGAEPNAGVYQNSRVIGLPNTNHEQGDMEHDDDTQTLLISRNPAGAPPPSLVSYDVSGIGTNSSAVVPALTALQVFASYPAGNTNVQLAQGPDPITGEIVLYGFFQSNGTPGLYIIDIPDWAGSSDVTYTLVGYSSESPADMARPLRCL